MKPNSIYLPNVTCCSSSIVSHAYSCHRVQLDFSQNETALHEKKSLLLFSCKTVSLKLWSAERQGSARLSFSCCYKLESERITLNICNILKNLSAFKNGITQRGFCSVEQFLGAFAKLRKATVNFVMPVVCPSVRPSIRVEKLCFH